MLVSTRLKTVASFINESDCLADIGADHGILEIYLLAKYSNIKITAIENKKGPYKILDYNLRSFKNIRLSLSDGLESVDKSIDTVVLAGMGGTNIIKILKRYPEKIRQLKKITSSPKFNQR